MAQPGVCGLWAVDQGVGVRSLSPPGVKLCLESLSNVLVYSHG